MTREEIRMMPFDWNDNLSEIAQEDFSLIQKNLSYGTASSIGMALAKLELLEKQGCKVEPMAESEDKNDNSIIGRRHKCNRENHSFTERI